MPLDPAGPWNAVKTKADFILTGRGRVLPSTERERAQFHLEVTSTLPTQREALIVARRTTRTHRDQPIFLARGRRAAGPRPSDGRDGRSAARDSTRRHRRRCQCPIKRRLQAAGGEAGPAGPLPGRHAAVISRVQTAASPATLRLSSASTGL